MPKRALAQKRPFLLLSVAAALAFYYLRASDVPELWLIPLKGSAVGLLAVYAYMRHSSPDAHLLAWAMAAAALGDMGIMFDRTIGALLFFAFHVLALGVFLRNRRPALTKTQSWVVGLTLILTPAIAYFFPYDRTMALPTAFYALALGAMASGAWASSFPRYRVGAGAMLFLLSDMLLFAEMGPLSGSDVPQYLVWPIYYLGQFLICIGVITTLRKRDPELRVVQGGRETAH
ncbi:lysoplasmalogenase family protein [Aurantiacibacter spongiae]|uniref:Lysoplasmalogenase n=1 Tax=Aurantiacibacter spongiae TaxID=2488860 RepID=A0A3N5CSN4_9SPHN|nr:lysoplasmalogenase family protein [Aurantiacibacter spongiae]RPF70330.1 lysoplasmalogenase [Aurantiacibacter spongiae]